MNSRGELLRAIKEEGLSRVMLIMANICLTELMNECENRADGAAYANIGSELLRIRETVKTIEKNTKKN